jgi:aminopeptidase C
MKELTLEAFLEKVKAYNEATAVFGKLSDNDIMKAYHAYYAIIKNEKVPDHVIVRDNMKNYNQDSRCPICDKKLIIWEPCCTNLHGYIGCVDPSCGYKEPS